MDLVITLPADLEKKLRQHAADLGKDASTFAREALEEKLREPRTIDEILAPFRKQVVQRGMSDQEMDEFYEGLRDEAWQERQGPNS
jgi:predicted DNA-binding protein